jgi:hypothetical protein
VTVLTNLAAVIGCLALIAGLAGLGHRQAWVAELDEWHTIDDPAPEPIWEPADGWDAYPARQTPTDLGRAYDPPGLPWRQPSVAGMHWMTDGYLRARVPIPWPVLAAKLGCPARRSDTLEFARIIAPITDHWCDSCRLGRDRERRHQSCPGCACPCQSPAVLIGRPPNSDRRSDLPNPVSAVEHRQPEASIR